MNKAQIAKLVGVAPINRDSGQMRGKRQAGKGRPRRVMRKMIIILNARMRDYRARGLDTYTVAFC
jgi:Transposase IS116/IS110/IS902 family